MQVEFFVPGHTHNDVDAAFGQLSQKLQRNDAWTPAEMHSLFMESAEKASNLISSTAADGMQESSSRTVRVVEVASVPNFQELYSWQVTTGSSEDWNGSDCSESSVETDVSESSMPSLIDSEDEL